jgi:hypothetical protein
MGIYGAGQEQVLTTTFLAYKSISFKWQSEQFLDLLNNRLIGLHVRGVNFFAPRNC